LHAGGLALNEITCQHYSPYYPIAKIQDLIGFDKIQTIGGETISILEHEAITLQVQAIIIMSMNPRRLPRHHHLLLLKQDFARLGSGRTIHKQSCGLQK
jgi:hypothetical protein